MKKILFSCVLLVVVLSTIAQKNKSLFKGMYLQWGYNTEWYTKSTIHFNTSVNGVPHNFTIYKAKASDRPDLDAIAKKPIEFTLLSDRIFLFLSFKELFKVNCLLTKLDKICFFE